MGKLKRVKPKTRESWLKERNMGIGASESSVVAGVSPFMTIKDLWDIKALGKERKDISSKPEVQRGVTLEPDLRNLYKHTHLDTKVTHHPFDMLYQDDYPFIFATLDGELKDKDGRKGILEIKTASPNNKAGWEKWKEQVPEYYYIQICHQLLATGYEFADLYAAIIGIDGDMVVRTYRFERETCAADMEWLKQKEIDFWKSVQNKTIPEMTIVF